MQHLLSQALEHEFPAAPHFEAEIKQSHLKKVCEQVLAAAQTADGRLPVDKPLRPLLRQIAGPLLLGEMGIDATHFLLGQHWRTHFTRKAAEAGGAMTVSQLRCWMDEPKPMGLPKEAQNLVLLTFAAQTNRTFCLHGTPYDVTLSNIPDNCELRQQKLPDEGAWEPAVQRAGSIFGVAVSRLLTAANVSTLTAGVQQKAGQTRRGCQAYCQRLRERMVRLGLEPDSTDRLRTATATLALVERIQNAEQDEVVERLARAEIATSEAAMGECVGKAAELEGNLDTAGWDIFEAVGKLTDERRGPAEEILAEVQRALQSDEHVVQLAPALKGAQAKAVRLLTKPTPPPIPRPVDTTKPPAVEPPPPAGRKVVSQGSEQDLSLPAAKKLLANLDAGLKSGQSARVNVSWTIEEGGSQS
jgi:hypothetical protein